jgi:hypothetical protein
MADEVPQYEESDGEEVEFGVAPPKRKRGAIKSGSLSEIMIQSLMG